MSSTSRQSPLHLLRVVCPDGTEVEAEHPGYTEYALATAGARALAWEMAGERPPFGRSEVAADLMATLEALGVDPLECEVTTTIAASPLYKGDRMVGGRVAVFGVRVADFEKPVAAAQGCYAGSY